MFTNPVVVFDEGSNSRSYVKCFYEGKRVRLYNGKKLGIHCFPNEAKTPAEKKRLLVKLQYELHKRLEKGWNPMEDKPQKLLMKTFTLVDSVNLAFKEMEKEELSERYRKDLKRVGGELMKFLVERQLDKMPLSEVDEICLQKFLSQFQSSATYYMTKRRTLAGLFSRIKSIGILPINPIYKTGRKKEVHILNAAFSSSHLKNVLTHLKGVHPKLHLCCLLMYGCFLRPHREIRLLQRRHINDDCTVITLSGLENKSKRVRVVYVPSYISKALLEYGLNTMDPGDYIINGSKIPVNSDYFKTVWTRVKKSFPEEVKLSAGQTLYSFRHSGALAVYEKTKDPYKVQQAMFHSSLNVTLTYLRSLGTMSKIGMDDLPGLE